MGSSQLLIQDFSQVVIRKCTSAICNFQTKKQTKTTTKNNPTNISIRPIKMFEDSQLKFAGSRGKG